MVGSPSTSVEEGFLFPLAEERHPHLVLAGILKLWKWWQEIPEEGRRGVLRA
jgi:hypothetical protein